MAKVVGQKSHKRPLTVPVLLTLCFVLLSLLAWGLFRLILQRDPAIVLPSALANTFLEDSPAAMSVYGDMYVDAKTDGSSFGLRFDGAIGGSGALDVHLNTDTLVAGSNGRLIKPSQTDKAYIELTNIADISSAYIVGGASVDTTLYRAVKNHKDQIDGRWYVLENQAAFGSLLDANGLTDFLPVLRAVNGEDRVKVAALYKTHPFLRVIDQSYGEILLQSPTAWYQLKIDTASLRSFLSALQAARLGSLPLTAEQVAQLERAFGRMSDVQVWVNPAGKRVEQVRIVYESDKNTITLRMRFSSNGSSVAPPVPAKSQSINTLMQLLGANH